MNKKPQVRNNQLTEQLSVLLNKTQDDIKKVERIKPQNYYNKEIDLQSWTGDNIDHINIWAAAETVLGKFLCHDTPHHFKHPVLGGFNTIRGFWYYIQSVNHDDRYRRLSGKPLWLAHQRAETVRIVNFRAILMDACWQRLKQAEAIFTLLKESTLPFDCYYIHNKSKLRVRPVFHSWITGATEEMRKAAKENREPDFGFLIEDHKIPLYDPITPNYLKQNTPVTETVDVNTPVEDGDSSISDQTVFEEFPLMHESYS